MLDNTYLLVAPIQDPGLQALKLGIWEDPQVLLRVPPQEPQAGLLIGQNHVSSIGERVASLTSINTSLIHSPQSRSRDAHRSSARSQLDDPGRPPLVGEESIAVALKEVQEDEGGVPDDHGLVAKGFLHGGGRN